MGRVLPLWIADLLSRLRADIPKDLSSQAQCCCSSHVPSLTLGSSPR